MNDIEETGIKILAKGKINVYPNPTKGLITIELKDFTFNNLHLKVTNIDGKVVYTKQLDTLNVIEELDLTNYASGVYFIKVYTDKISKTERLVIE